MLIRRMISSLPLLAMACTRTAPPPAPELLIQAGPPSASAAEPPALAPAACVDLSSCDQRCRSGEIAACLRGAEVVACTGDWDERPRAVPLLGTACDRGSTRACAELALIIDRGIAVPGRDPEALYEAACAAHDGAACSQLASREHDTDSLDKRVREHRALFGRLCAEGFLAGCSALHDYLVMDDPINGGPRDAAGAAAAREATLRLASKLCAAGDAGACELAGTMSRPNSNPNAAEREQAREMLRRALAIRERRCGEGDVEACREVASALQAGTLVARDEPRAAALYLEACKGGSVVGCKSAAVMVEMGHGGPRDVARANGLLEQACALCDGDACRMVAMTAEKAGRGWEDPRKKRLR